MIKAACEAECRRIVVLRVGGVIHLRKEIRISHPYITVAGQTAPGDGIQISMIKPREFPTRNLDAHSSPEDSLNCITVHQAHDVVGR